MCSSIGISSPISLWAHILGWATAPSVKRLSGCSIPARLLGARGHRRFQHTDRTQVAGSAPGARSTSVTLLMNRPRMNRGSGNAIPEGTHRTPFGFGNRIAGSRASGHRGPGRSAGLRWTRLSTAHRSSAQAGWSAPGTGPRGWCPIPKCGTPSQPNSSNRQIHLVRRQTADAGGGRAGLTASAGEPSLRSISRSPEF